MDLIKKPKIVFLIVLLVVAIGVILTQGLQYGLDFDGGTEFVLTLDEEVSDPDQLARIVTTISQRLDWSGLKDVKVASFDNRFIVADVAITDPDEIVELEEILQKQGRFENVFEEQVIFTGEDIVSVSRDPQQGYGVSSAGDGYKWSLPFLLEASSARDFSEAVFHKCVPTPSGEYDCPKTYFFIDRPENAIIIMPSSLYQEEEFLPADPVRPMVGSQIKAEDLLNNAQIEFFVKDNIDENFTSKLLALKESGKNKIIVPYGYDVSELEDLNMELMVVPKGEVNPWLWDATGLKSVIWVTSGITNQDASTMDSTNFNVHYNLIITGSAVDLPSAQKKIEQLYVLLGAGSLPVGVESISRETVDPVLGASFLQSVLIMGIIALLMVALVVFIRYRNPKLVIPILIASSSEIVLILGFAALIKWNLDLAALAGILAAVGTGVDHQIIITDELNKSKDDKHEQSLLTRVKNAFFIIFASATTTFVVMFPIILFSFGLGKLTGFALTTIIGVFIGVFITRPAYAEMAKYIIGRK